MVAFTLKTDGPCDGYSLRYSTLPRVGEHINEKGHVFLVTKIVHSSYYGITVRASLEKQDFN